MQGAHQGLRNELWDRFKVIYEKYATNGGQIQTQVVDDIVRNVLGQTTQQQVDYVTKNMFRVDSDGSGKVSLLQLGNFLFKKHCGEISLQKMHKAGKISHGSQRKINLQEFRILLDNAYKFLGVKANENFVTEVFKEVDKNEDGFISYVEYFQFNQKYICQTAAQFSQYQKSPEKVKDPEPVTKPVDLGRQWNGRLRLYLWGQLRRLYEAFVLGKQVTINDQNLRRLVFSLLGQLNDSDLTLILSGLYRLDKGNLQFLPFAIVFFSLVAELGLSQYHRNHLSTKKFLNPEQFIIVLRNTFKFLGIGRIRKQILLLIFKKIDTNNDGLISLSQYQNWVQRYLSVDLNRGQDFYLKQDDQAIGGGDIFDNQTVLSVIPDLSQKKKNLVFKFTNYDFSDQVRKRVWDLLVPFDKNKDQKFDQSQIQTALIQLLKESQLQLAYVTRNVFRYDVDNDKNVTYAQLTNFCVEQHFGEMAIQRLHKKQTYVRGSQRIMNQAQFGITINNALSFIEMQAPPELISELFIQIDIEKTGWITYQVYFLFLRYYFGSLRGYGGSVTTVEVNDPDLDWWNSLSGLSALERFIRIIFDQLRSIFLKYDFNKNLRFEEEQIQAILHHVFGLNQTQIDFIISKFFNFASRQNKSLSHDQLVRILLQVYFCHVILKRRFPQLQPSQWKTKKISLQEFIELVLYACFFLRRKPSNGDLTQIFQTLDTDKDGYITFWQFIQFIRKYLGIGLQQFDEVQEVKPVVEIPKPPQISTEQWDFINEIWGELKAYFDKYDSGSKGYLTESDLKSFIIQVLREDTQRQLDYVFWNLFRVDVNSDKKTEFNQFAPFILNHAGEIALQRFHRHQIAGKNTLNYDELFIVFSNAFRFLSTMPKSQGAVKLIYTRIGKGGDPNYASYLGWINRALANRFRK